MNVPTQFAPRRVAPDTDAIVSYAPLPGAGILPVNAFLIRSTEPVLVDTGMPALREAFLKSLESMIALEEIRWIWLTHVDPDHTGALEAVLAAAPRARVVTTYLGMGKMNVLQFPVERAYLLNPGQSLDVGDRVLTALKPPLYDAPETTGLLDRKTRALFSADSFGALLREPVEDAAGIPPGVLEEGLVTWATVDSPWLHLADPALLDESFRLVRDLDPSVILSSHLPPAERMTGTLLDLLARARTARPFVGPDQSALEQMFAQPA